ncbi:bifunctional glutamate N-acetyltransferase/amino-acid acetyltransferase ArgJ [Desulfitobacterium sp.]|uniref:bifunctional glutamate N-acetyltransferase/amino-acid acetyltransferase ArgJ n=1 Tax=Desulfitobacterium sp. TaxID=49981 RepID=UPI002B562D62|nr:bifunctional glutamate N-acetyltransferase/amino-acid acetyltransferase ArgJ [Desulfitobacterium sp.]HVJ48354.1 bifunctional glutamate N-acetyltransferase/amino-acid acetyltransferase ArgJ [Desulfitobacterium sp.]
MCGELNRPWTWIEGGVGAPQGFQATGVKAEIKYQDKYDVALIYSSVPAQAAGVFTRNQVKAHPLVLTQKYLEDGVAQAIVANSGNANACVGEAGDQAALEMARTTASTLGLKIEDVLVASTGVIGVEMPVERLAHGIEEAAQILTSSETPTWTPQERIENAHQAALAIMTTDTKVKELACELPCHEGVIRLGGIAKGSGMIHPNMGTMLGFITTDAKLPAAQLQGLLRQAVDQSFNMVTVDGDTSTNDMVLFLANGESGITPVEEEWLAFQEMVNSFCIRLAQEIARDGEGATKFLEVQVTGAKSLEDARKLAKSICGSSLVKTAMYGEDANWGRILAAAGYAGAEFNPSQAAIYLGECLVAQNGQGVHFSEEVAKGVLSQKEIKILLQLKDGEAQATAWGCDLTHEYVTINGDYRT